MLTPTIATLSILLVKPAGISVAYFVAILVTVASFWVVMSLLRPREEIVAGLDELLMLAGG